MINGSYLSNLPKLFCKDDTHIVDDFLIKEVIKAEATPSKKIKLLFKQLNIEKTSKNDDYIKLLTIKIADGEFRKKWYTLSEQNQRSGILTPFHVLVAQYVCKNDTALNISSEYLEDCFEVTRNKEGKKHYPKIENIHILVEKCLKHSELAPLFLWCIIENIEYSILSGSNDSRLVTFKNELFKELTNQGAQKFIDLLTPYTWEDAEHSKIDNLLDKTNHTKIPTIEKKAHVKIKNPADNIFQKIISDLSESQEKVKASVNLIELKAKSILNTKNNENNLELIHNQVSLLQDSFKTISDSILAFQNNLNGFLDPLQNKIGFNLNLQLPKFNNINTLDQTILEIEKIRTDSTVSFHKLIEISKSSQVKHVFKENEKKSFQNINEMDVFCKTLSYKIDILENGAASLNKLNTIITNNKNVISNPLSEENIKQYNLKSIFLYKKTLNEIDELACILASKLGSRISEEICETIEYNFKDLDLDKLTKIIMLLNYLSLEVIEKLSQQHSFLKPVISLSYIHLALQSKVSLTAKHLLFNSKVFLDFKSNTNKNLSNFLNEITLYLTDANNRNGYPFLIRKLNGLPNEFKSVDLANKYISDLKNILIFYKKGGGTTYSHIWSAAYKDIFEPLAKIIDTNDLDRFLIDFNEVVENLDLDTKLNFWKTNIPEHLKKNSEYNKTIKIAVRSKLDEISTYIDENNNFRTDDKKDSFSKTLNSLLADKNSDSKIFQFWLNDLVFFEKKHTTYSFLKSYSDEKSLISYEKIPSNFINSFIKSVKKEEVDNDDLLGDALVSISGVNTPTALAKKYYDHDMLEGYSKILTETDSNEINPETERLIERKLEEKNEYYKKKLSDIEQSISSIDDSEKELCNAEYLMITRLLERQQWYQFEFSASELESVIESYKRDSIESKKIAELKERIYLLTGQQSQSNEVEMLISQHAHIVEKMSKKMLHISQLQRLKTLPLAESRLSKLIDECYIYFYDKVPYPEETLSEMISFTWQQAIDPLSIELSRIKTLLPSYSLKLKLLTETLIINLMKEDVLENNSKFNEMILETSDTWKELPSNGEKGINHLYHIFEDNGFEVINEVIDSEDDNNLIVNPDNNLDIDIIDDNRSIDTNSEIDDIRTSLITTINNSSYTISSVISDKDLVIKIDNRNWNEILSSSPSLLVHNNDSVNSWRIMWWGISGILLNKDHLISITQSTYILSLMNEQKIFSDDPKNRSLCLQIIHIIFKRIYCEMNSDTDPVKSDSLTISDIILFFSNNIQDITKYSSAFKRIFQTPLISTPFTLKVLWDSFSGDSKQANLRASFMYIAWNLHATPILEKCFTFPPIDLDQRKAIALADISEKALIAKNYELLQPLYDLKTSLSSKPFTMFVDLLSRVAPVYSEQPAKLDLIGSLELVNSRYAKGRLCITPRKNDAPDRLIITLPPKGPLRFNDNKLKLELIGPFLIEKIIPVDFILLDSDLENFNIEIEIESTSITDIKNTYSCKINVLLLNSNDFELLTPDEIELAFDNFPEQQMRGSEYVSREEDEKRIERALITSKTVRSMWITSPRRSGKTTMLYRILDAYSHKVGRDIIVIYLTMDEKFNSTNDFNRWIWKRLRTLPANRELNAQSKIITEIGKDLNFDNDVGTFISSLSEKLILTFKEQLNAITRVIFMFDEVDKFASMYFQSAEQRDTVNDVLWQIRSMISTSRNVGIVFAGSTAAKEIFISNPESPFYNSIEHIELTPFSCKSKSAESASRQIVEPLKLRGKFELNKRSLEHLLWVCAGIPYYMKLLAGSTYAVIKQGKIIESDINDGLNALLKKETGIAKLDGMGGEPGTDDLRTTLTLKNNNDGLIARAVLFTLAELHSPVSGHPVLRGRLSSNECKLVYEYKLTRKQINNGIDTCIKLGLIKSNHGEHIEKLYFSIPILGESIRYYSHKFWSGIHTELQELVFSNGDEK